MPITPPELPGTGPLRSRKRKKKRRGKAAGRVVRRLLALTGLGLLGWLGWQGFNWAFEKMGPIAAFSGGEFERVLVVGQAPQAEAEAPRAEFLHLMATEGRRQGYVLSLPVQTRVLLGDQEKGTLADALATGGLPLLKQTIEDLSGLTLSHHLVLNRDQIVPLLALAGPIHVPDREGADATASAAGWKQLPPEQSLDYIWPPGADPGSIQHQQRLFDQWQKKAQGTWDFSWVPGLSRPLPIVPDSDLGPEALVGWLRGWERMPPARLVYASLPGELSPEGDWISRSRQLERLVSKLENPAAPRPIAELSPSVEILYEAPRDREVLALASRLTERGFKVLRTGREPVEETVLVDRAPERSPAVAEALHQAIGGLRVVVAPDEPSAYGARYSLRLGADYFE